MAKRYPRRYLVVEGDKIERVTVRDPVQEAAIVIKYVGILGLSKPEIFDDSRFVIEKSSNREEG